MKNTAVILRAAEDETIVRSYLTWVRQETGADRVIVLLIGDFTENGFPSCSDKYSAAETMIKAGADLVFEMPIYCSWMTKDGMAFAAAAMLEKMGCIEDVVLPCFDADKACIENIVMYLFKEPPAYQAAFRKYRAQGESILRAQTKALGVCMEGADAFMENPCNALAVELAKSLKRMYSSIKTVFTPVEDPAVCGYLLGIGETMDAEQDLKLGNWVREKVLAMEEKKARDYLNEIYGGFDPYTVKLMDTLKEAHTFTEISEILGKGRKAPAEIRNYLLRVLCGFRGVENSICGLYTYVLYYRLLAASGQAGELAEQIRIRSGLPLLYEKNAQKQSTNIDFLDEECKKIIASCEGEIHSLYTRMTSGQN